ncbi:VOC family protein [Luedemannella helvata]|uniref:VOC family protein n=1 Tax=Luedemannella helvata TaxID=349315 RepID=A0ABP4VTE6_9ACTN
MAAVGAGVPGWVDLGSPDLAVTRRFYGELFGWEPRLSPSGEYTTFLKDGLAVAGAGPLMTPDQPVVWTTYIIVTDADDTAAKAESAGGQLIAPPFDIRDLGRMAIILDPTGAVVGIWQPGTMSGAELFNAPGALSWEELFSQDVAAAKAFYCSVFGWATEDTLNEAGEITYTQWMVGGRPIGGMMAMADLFGADVPPHWAVYFGVANADEAAATITRLGGTLVRPPVDIPEGRFANALDPHGASFSIFEAAD